MPPAGSWHCRQLSRPASVWGIAGAPPAAAAVGLVAALVAGGDGVAATVGVAGPTVGDGIATVRVAVGAAGAPG